MDLGLAGRVAVVLGSTSGLGRACAQALAAEGAHIVVVGRRAAIVDEVAAELPSAIGVANDLRDADAPCRIASCARAEFGHVDILVLNGGGPEPGLATDLDVEDLQDATNLLVAPHIAMVRQVLPEMCRGGWGRIIGIGSSGVQQPITTLAASNLGRAALAAYLKSLSHEVAAAGVTVNMVLPGRIDTQRVANLDEAAAQRQHSSVAAIRAASEEAIPRGRYGHPHEFAAVVAFLASSAASYVTGEQVRCDGGLIAAY